MPGEACVVADTSIFQHIIDVYNSLAVDSPEEEKESWYSIAAIIEDWVTRTLDPSEDEFGRYE